MKSERLVSGRLHFVVMVFFLLVLWVHIFLIAMYALCSMGSLIWCLYFRSLSSLYKLIKKSKLQGYEWEMDSPTEDDAEDLMKTGKDFLFLFDLLFINLFNCVSRIIFGFIMDKSVIIYAFYLV